MDDGLRYLRKAHANGNLVPFVGAGYSAAEAGLPAWPQLLHEGIGYLRGESPKIVKPQQLRSLESITKAGDLLTAFGFMQGLMAEKSSEHFEALRYQGFLNEVFHYPSRNSDRISQALRGLHPRVVLTTNYDLLLEEFGVARHAQSATWLETARIRSMLRSDGGVIHLHGRYDVPRSIILSNADYQRIVADGDSIAIAQAAFHSGVLLFIGSSVDGVSDPHMRKILGEFARMSNRTQQEDAPHIALFKGRLSGMEIAQLRAHGIEAVSYGEHYDDLPRFLEKIVENESITLPSTQTRALVRAVKSRTSPGNALSHMSDFIRHEIFPHRQVRITYCELVDLGAKGRQLEAHHVLPLNATRNVFNYPLSIAAWSLIEGRIIAWPEERSVKCNFMLLGRLGRLDRVYELLASENVATSPEIARYLDLSTVIRRFEDRELILGDFFQDWSSGQPDARYDRFICVPVPIIDSFGNREDVQEYGVFNIDCRGNEPLLDRKTTELLKLASTLTSLLYE